MYTVKYGFSECASDWIGIYCTLSYMDANIMLDCLVQHLHDFTFLYSGIYLLYKQYMRDHVKKQRPICRRDDGLLCNPPTGTSFHPQNVHCHYGPRMHRLECFFVQISRNPFSKSGQNCDAVIPLNRANSGDLNGVIPVFIPIPEGEIWNLPGFCLPALPGRCR